jgi:hypothetical protein
MLGRRKSKEGSLDICMHRVHIVCKECATNSFDSEAQEE